MATEVWVRNPQFCIKECVEVDQHFLVWDRGYLTKYRLDPTRFADIYFPSGTDYRMLAVGDQGSADLRPGYTMSNPFALYPTWEYAEDAIDDLEDLLAHPTTEEPRVVVTQFPDTRSRLGMNFLRVLSSLQVDYPESIIHIHGLYGWTALFANGWRSVDIEPREAAMHGRVHLPSGKTIEWQDAPKLRQWVELVGYHATELAEPRARCMYNIDSARWAAKHFEENIRFKSSGRVEVDPDAYIGMPFFETKRVKSKHVRATVGDKFLCDLCSLQDTCKYYRSRGVCAIPGSEPSTLAKHFKTRNADTIIDGLGTLLAAQSERLEEGREHEIAKDKLDPEVTKILNSIFQNGVKLAKLLDPSRFAAPRVGININAGGAAQLATATPQQMVAAAVKSLEDRGIPREDITPEMIRAVLDPTAAPAPVRAALPAGDGPD